MRTINTFSLAKHAGPYETWPAQTRLLADGAPTRLELRGYDLRWQFQVDERFLLITDCDCPFEEVYEVYLLSRELRVLSHHSDPARATLLMASFARAMGVMSSNLYCDAEILNERRVRLLGCARPPHLEITVLDKRPFGFGRLLRLLSST